MSSRVASSYLLTAALDFFLKNENRVLVGFNIRWEISNEDILRRKLAKNRSIRDNSNRITSKCPGNAAAGLQACSVVHLNM
jgi:hypothetical protein